MTEDKHYCIYSNEDCLRSEMNDEHIIPLSLGGHNNFTILAKAGTNSHLGSRIEGRLANEFLFKLRRNHLDLRGHSNERPIPIIKKAKIKDYDNPVQMPFDKFSKELKLFDPVGQKYFSPPAGSAINIETKMELDLPLQFSAKVALGAGYYVYGELFKKYVKHEDLRLIMHGPSKLTEAQLKSVTTRTYSIYSQIEEKDKMDIEVTRTIFSMVEGSVVMIVPMQESIVISVGIVGLFMGMVNIPATTDHFPKDGMYDMGHVITITKKGLVRGSCRKLLTQVQRLL